MRTRTKVLIAGGFLALAIASSLAGVAVGVLMIIIVGTF